LTSGLINDIINSAQNTTIQQLGEENLCLYHPEV